MGDNHVIPDFLMRMKSGTYSLYGHEDTRSFIYIDDAVRATLMLALADKAANETVNVGSEQEVTILEVGQKILEIEGVNEEIELNDSPKGSVRRRAPDTSKLQALTGFAEEWSLTRGLTETIEFYLRGSTVGV
jgi:nucleoside-diphosphate-sugar epimerase